MEGQLLSDQIPDFVQDRIKQINERTGINIDEITRSYLDLFNDDFVKKDEQFANDDERHRYANAVLWSMYVARQPVKEQDVVPIGFDAARTSRAGNMYSTIYAVAKGKKGIKRISCMGDALYLYRQINLFYQYTTKLGEFKGGDYQADNRTKFERPVRLKLSPQQFMDKLGVKRIPDVISAKKFPSARDGKNRVDNSDWRVIRGIIATPPRTFTRDDGSEGAVYTLSDDSINGGESVTDEGDVVAGLTTWAAPELAVWQQYDEVDAYGTNSIDKDGKPNFNGYLFIPIHARGGS